MIVDSFSFASLRLLALMFHFLFTTFLYWTKQDSLQVALKPTSTVHDYEIIDSAYTGLISFGLICITFNIVSSIASTSSISFFGIIQLFLDVVACFFVAWIALDGLEWTTYVYILVFCILVPALGDVLKFGLFINKNIWVNWRNPVPVYQSVYDAFDYCKDKLAALIVCCVAMTSSSQASDVSLLDRCISCLSTIQDEGISGICMFLWSSLLAIPGYIYDSFSWCISEGPSGIFDTMMNSCSDFPSPSAMYDSCYNWFCVSGGTASSESIFLRAWGCIAYMASATWDALSTYGPQLFNLLRQLVEAIGSGLLWIWRQLKLFCR
mmetsp:Transcript_3062/g.4770  ORF Transcript_3062/g.4770 Transcript_3062/m.4770 type:complete len:323 (-) Transcript_3062:1140-2108(-)